MRIEFRHDAREVCFHRCRADEKALADLVVAHTTRDERQNLALAIGQAAQIGRTGAGRRARGDERLDQPARDGRLDKRIAGGDDPNRRNDLVRLGIFQQKAARAGRKGVVDVFVQVERRQDKHLHVAERRVRADCARRLDAVRARHADVHEHNVGTQTVRQRCGLVAIARLADHLDTVVRRQDQAEPAAHKVLVVGDEHADGVSGVRAARCVRNGCRDRGACRVRGGCRTRRPRRACGGGAGGRNARGADRAVRGGRRAGGNPCGRSPSPLSSFALFIRHFFHVMPPLHEAGSRPAR